MHKPDVLTLEKINIRKKRRIITIHRYSLQFIKQASGCNMLYPAFAYQQQLSQPQLFPQLLPHPLPPPNRLPSEQQNTRSAITTIQIQSELHPFPNKHITVNLLFSECNIYYSERSNTVTSVFLSIQ